MKKIFFIFLILIFKNIFLISITIDKIWTIQNLDVPESAIYYQPDDIIFVSNINGDPTDFDKNGYISKIKPDGKILDKKWIATLDAPKGMAIFKHYLFVADINQLVIIDIKKSEITDRILIKDSDFLNDVAADSKGNIYISDSSSSPGIIYKYSKNKVERWFISSKIKRPNGLLVINDTLYVGSFANGNLLKLDINSKKLTLIGHFINAIDGITIDSNENIILSNWFNTIAIVKNFNISFPIKLNHNCADIYYIKKYNILLIPTFFNNKLIAYKIKH